MPDNATRNATARGRALLLCALIAAAAGACSSTADALPKLDEPPFPQGWTLLDVTRPIDTDTPYLAHPEAFPFERIPLGADASGRKTGAYSLLEHMGTHVESPRAYSPGVAVDGIGPDDLLAPLVVLDPQTMVAGAGATDAGLGVAALRAQELLDGTIPRGAVVLLRTGRGALSNRAIGDPGEGPVAGWSAEAIRFLAAERGVRAVGTDALTLDPGAEGALAAKAAAEEGVYALLGLRDLASIPRRGSFIVVGVVPIAGAASAQARVLVLVPPPLPAVLPGTRGG